MHPDELEKRAEFFLHLRNADPHAVPHYDGFADALIWPDEVPRSQPLAPWALLQVWQHRTALILGKNSAYEGWWRRARQLYPDWIGFMPGRCSPSQPLASLYHQLRYESELKAELHDQG